MPVFPTGLTRITASLATEVLADDGTHNGWIPLADVAGLVPSATPSSLGVVQPDNSTITVVNGILSSLVSGGVGLPTSPNATLDGTSGQTTINPAFALIYLAPGNSFTDAAPAPYTLTLPSQNKFIRFFNIGTGVAGITAQIAGQSRTMKIYPQGAAQLFADVGAGTYRLEDAFDPGLTAPPALSGDPVSGDQIAVNHAGLDFTYEASKFALKANLSAATGQLFGGTGTNGTAVAITLGSGLTLTGNVLTAAGGGGSSGPVTPLVLTSNPGTPIPNTHGLLVVVNKSSGSATPIALSASPPAGTVLQIKDGKGDAATNPITITPASGTIDGQATWVIGANRTSVELKYNGTEWSVV